MTSKLKLIIFVLIIGLLSAGSALKPAHADFLSYIHWPSSENTLSQGGEDYGAPALLYRPGIMYMTVPRPDGPISDLQILSSTDMSTWTLVTTISGSHSHAGKMGFIFNPQDQKYYIAYMSDGELVHIPTPSDVPFVADVPMMVVRSSTDLLNWSNPTNMTWEFDNTNYAWDINGPTIVLDSANNRLLVEYAKTLGSPCSCKEVFLNQTSGPNFGQTWSSVSLNPISYGGSPLKVSTTPDLKFINGKLYMTYVDVGPSGGAIHVIQSTDGITWTNKADIPGQTAYSAVIDYNPAEYYPFHLMWVGTDSSYTINDMSSATAMSWTNQETFNGLNGAPLALSHVYPSLTFDANLDILVMAHTGTDWYTQWGYGDYMHVLPEVGAVNDAGFVNQGGSSLFQSTTTTSTFKPNQGTFIEKNNPTYSCAGCGIYIVETDTTRYYSKADTYTSFIGFNPSIPANSVISKATIALTVYDTKQNLCLNMACPMTVSAITSSWTAASVNWDSPPSTSCFSSCVTISAGLVAKGETDTIDISSLVNQAYDAGQFFGIKIETNPTCGYDLCEDWYVDYYSQVTNSGPVLTLTYTYTPSTATLCAGQSAALTVTMSNRGSTIWQPVSTLPGFPFRLGSQNPPGNTIWGISRVDLSSPVRPTTNYVFSFTITAPSTPGTYNLQWQMVQDGIITWFGDKTPNIQVTVTPPCPPDFTISATSPSAVDAGSTGTSTVTINYVNGFTGTVALTATAPAPLNCYSLTPGSLSSTGTAILYCASPSAGTFPVTITGTSGSITHTTVATFTYTDFTVSSLPSTVNIPPSGSGTATLNLSSVNGFAGSVYLQSGQSIYKTPSIDGAGSGYCHSTSSTTCTATLTTRSAGDLVIVFASSPTTLTTGFSITDAAGLSFNSRILSQANYGPFQEISVQEFWTTASSTLTSDVITMTTHDPSGCCPGHNLELIVFAVSGTNYQFDGSPMSAIGSTGNPVLYPHTNGYNEMIIAYAVDGVQVLTAGSPYSFIGTSGNNGAEYLVLPGPAGPSASFGNSQGEWAEVVDIIQPIPGISFSFSPQSVPLAASGTSSSTVTVAVANFVPIGTYTVYISSTAPSILHLIPITVNVANFLISANPPTVITNIGSTGASTIKVTPLGTFSAAVNLSLNNAACTVSPTSVTAGGNSTVSCMSPNATMFVVTVTGTSGSESHSTPVTYIIQDFNISATPTNALINTGSSSLSTITLRSINWFQGTIGLSYVSVPTGLSCSPFSPASINLPQSVVTATATFYCNSSSLGTYSIVVRGTSGSITHNATATFSFSDLTISGSPSTVNMLPSGSGTSTINLASNGFSGTVSLYSCSTCQSVYAMPTLDGWASGYCHSTGSTQCSATLSTHSSGDLIIVFVSSPTTLSNGFTLSDAAGLSFNSRIFVQASYGNPFQDISVKEFWAISSSPLTSDTITMTTQDPPFCCPGHNLELIAFGVSGSNYQFDGPPVASIQPSGNPGVTVPTNGPNRMIIGYAVDGSQSLTAGQGFVFIGTSGNNGAEYLVAPTGALVSFGNAQGEWAEVADAIQPASGFSISFVPSNIPLSNGGTAGSTATITAASFVPMGTYTVTVVGATSIGSRSASIVVNVGNFGIATSPTTVVANVGYPGMSTITVTPVGGFTGTVGLSVNNPACTLSPSSVTGSGTSTLSCSSPNPTSFTVTVIGTSGAESHTATVVYAFQDFTVSGPSKVSVTEGYYSRIPITWTALSSNLAPMNITFSGSVPQPYQPSGSIRTGPLGISFSPASLVLGPGQSANVLMILSDAGAPAGVTYYPIQVTGTNGPATHTVVMNATVTGYSISSEGGYQCTATNYILCLSAQQNAVPGVPVDLFASGITGTVTYTTSISACVSGCNGGTPPTVYWLDTGTSSSNITITSTSCNLRNIYSTSNTASFCGNKELIIHAYSGIGNYNITVGATCVSGFCVNYGFGPKTYTFYILFNVFTSGGGGGGSVAAGTLITLADGSQVPVQNLHIGEQLLSYDLTSGQYVVTNITRLATVETYNQMVISTGNGKPLIVDQNPAQKLYVRLQDGKVTLMSVTDLRVGYDLFYATSQTWVPIISIHYENSGTHLMYDIYTTSPGNYVANGYLDPLKT